MAKVSSSLLLCLAGLTSVTPASAQSGGECGMSRAFVHQSRDGPRPIYEGDGALLFKAPMAVNTDGAPTSYHPDDPWGDAGLAINTICNGAHAILPSGEKVDYTDCRRLVDAFRAAKAAGWRGGAPRMQFYAVATRDGAPCMIADGPHAGYFVSTTSLAADQTRGACDQERYLNALTMPFIIYPGAARSPTGAWGPATSPRPTTPTVGVSSSRS